MTFLLAAMTSIAATATEANDTIADVASPNQVVVTENDHLIQVHKDSDKQRHNFHQRA